MSSAEFFTQRAQHYILMQIGLQVQELHVELKLYWTTAYLLV